MYIRLLFTSQHLFTYTWNRLNNNISFKYLTSLFTRSSIRRYSYIYYLFSYSLIDLRSRKERRSRDSIFRRRKVICPTKGGLINRYTRFRLRHGRVHGNSESVSDRVPAPTKAEEPEKRRGELKIRASGARGRKGG